MSGREYKVEYPREMQFCVPDGMWVAEAYDGSTKYYSSDPSRGSYQEPFAISDSQLEVIGAETQRIQIWQSYGNAPVFYDPETDKYAGPATENESRHWLYIARQPFGIITTPTENGVPSSQLRHFTPARQIHKGELGRKVPVSMPDTVRTFIGTDLDEGYGANQQTIGWVRLDDIQAKVRLTTTELLRGFFPFNDYVTAHLPMVIATAPEDFAGRVVRYPQRNNFGLELAITEAIRHPMGFVWVRASWAATVLRLHRLGYKPSAVA